MAHIKKVYEAWETSTIQTCASCSDIYRAAKPGPRRLCSACYLEMRQSGLEDENPNAAWQDDPLGATLWLLDYKPHVLIERLYDYGMNDLAEEVIEKAGRDFPATLPFGSCVSCGWEWHLDDTGGRRRLCNRCYFNVLRDGTLSSYPVDHFWDYPGEYADWSLSTKGNADGNLVRQALSEYTPWFVKTE